MIVAKEMEKAMHRQMGEVMKEDAVFIGAFSFERLEGDDNIAEQASVFAGRGTGRRKRQYVCRPVDAAPVPIERTVKRGVHSLGIADWSD